MKKIIVKVLSGLIIFSSLFSVAASANANEYSGWRSNTIFYDGQPTIAYADSSQWDKRYDSVKYEYYWVCATPDFQQGYCNAWICTDGKWYFLNTDGRMETDVLIGDKSKKERYLLDETGAMETNTYWDQFGSSNYIDSNGLVNLPDVYYKMMPTSSTQSQLVTVPNLVESSIETAKNALSNINLNYSIIFYDTNDQSNNGKVLKQSDFGKVQEGSTITLTVGKYSS